MRKSHKNIMGFMDTATSLVSSTYSKSSSQSDVYVLSRRPKLGAELVSLDSNGVPMIKVDGKSWMHTIGMDMNHSATNGWFGNPTIRGISKFFFAIMQITLKVKSIGSIQSSSPTFSLLDDTGSSVVLLNTKAIEIHTDIPDTPEQLV